MTENTHISIVSGFFSPIHLGHLNYLKESKKLASRLVVIVNSDEQVALKGSVPFMNEDDRLEIVQALACVDQAVISIDEDGTVAKTIEFLAQIYEGSSIVFCNGGDRPESNHVAAEKVVCDKYGIELAYGVGGHNKRESSSELIKRAVEWLTPKRQTPGSRAMADVLFKWCECNCLMSPTSSGLCVECGRLKKTSVTEVGKDGGGMYKSYNSKTAYANRKDFS